MKFRISIFLVLLFFYMVEAQDWQNLNRYQKENKELMTFGIDENRVVFMGNSITEGWLKIRPDFFKNKPYVNRGVSGQTTPQMLLRFKQDVINLKPSVVVILAGVNDIAENTGPITIDNIFNNIISMIELAKVNNIKVILCSVLPVLDFPWRRGLKPSGKIINLNNLLRGYAKQHSLVYVDYFSIMVNSSNGLIEAYGYDGVHPNELGYSIMEPLLEKGITEVFNQD